MWDILTQDEKNKILLKLLVHISKADLIIKEGELAYLLHICRNLGLDPELIRTYILQQDENIHEILPQTEQDRMNILFHLLFTMKSDYEIHPYEENQIFSLSFKLGFSEDMTRDFIQLMKEHTSEGMPLNGMLEIVRKHNN
jgi:hypothetical protein